MDPDQYTADVICHSMCIGTLIDPKWGADTVAIRVLLKPSFDPEACITVTLKNGTARLNITVLAASLWQQDHACRLPAHHEDCDLPLDQFNQTAHWHHTAVTDTEAQRFICLDGMGLNCAWTSAGDPQEIQSHCSAYQPMRDFVAHTIDLAWRLSSNVGVRNGLAACGRYVGADYPMESVPPKPALFRLGVFGSPDDVDGYFRALRSASKEA